MSARTARIILLALAALVALYAVSRWVGRRGGETAGLEIGAVVDTGVSLIRIRQPGGDTVRLARSSEGWLVNGWPADTGEVRPLLAGLDTARAAEVVSRSPENHDRLGVTDTTGARVDIGPADAPVLSLYIGQSGRGGRFVREAEAAEVRLLPGNVGSLLARGADAWRDRLVLALDTSQVREVVVRREKARLVLSRPDSVWVISGAVADTARVADLLGALSRLTAARFPPDSVALRADFDSPDAVVEAYEEPNGAEAGSAPLGSLLLVREGEGADYLVRRADRPVVYGVAGWAVDRLLPTEKDLLP